MVMVCTTVRISCTTRWRSVLVLTQPSPILFSHHLILTESSPNLSQVPGLHGRGGIYFDDHEGSISNCSGNVMYKAAGRAFLVNGGAGNNITHNLIVVRTFNIRLCPLVVSLWFFVQHSCGKWR